MSAVVAGALAVTPLYTTPADAIVLWDDPGQTWRSLAYLPLSGGTISGNLTIIGLLSAISVELGPDDGVTTPYIDFHGATTWTDFATRLIRYAGDNGQFVIASRGTGGLNFSSVEAAPLILGTSSTERLRITPAGNVGIGTAGPGFPLDVVGKINATGEFRTTGAAGSASVGAGIAHFGRDASRGAQILGDGLITDVTLYNAAGSPAAGVLTGTTNFWLAGNVGIGTATPAVALDVRPPYAILTVGDGTGNPEIMLRATGSGTGGAIYSIGHTAANTRHTLIGDYSAIYGGAYDNRLVIRNDAGIIMNQTGGNVGIGTASPLMRLHVASTGGAPANSGTAAVGGVRVAASSGGNALDIGMYTATPYGAWLQGTDQNNLALTYPLVLNPNGGNVGIGTAAPDQKLTVSGGNIFNYATSAAGTAQITAAAFDYASVPSYKSSTLSYYGDTYGGNAVTGVPNANLGALQFINVANGLILTNNSPLIFATGAVERARITAVGNVGIGTTSPAQKVHISSGAGTRTSLMMTDGNTASLFMAAGASLPATLAADSSLAFRTSVSYPNADTGVLAMTIAAGSGATANISGAWTTISARELKDAESVQPYTRGLEALVQLRPVTFRYLPDSPFARPADDPGDPLIGLIADEVAPYVPEIVGETTATVGRDAREVAISTLEPGLLIFSVINALREVATRLSVLEAKV